MKSILFFVISSILITNVFSDNTNDANSGSTNTQSAQNRLKQPNSKTSLIIINEDDWDQMLQGEWMVEFHAPWCPACRALQPEWTSFSVWGSDLGIKVGAVDVTANPGLTGRFMVTALPSIYHVKDGVFRQYKGTRDSNTFISFIEEKKWQSIDPISSWKSPNSIPMSIVSNFFKISMTLRAVHNSLVEDYGIPYWGSYIFFAFATILFGAMLGLIIVFIIDIIFPAKPQDEILKRPATQEDLIDDTEDLQNKRPADSDETEEEDLTDEHFDEDEEFDEENDDNDEPQIEEIVDDELIESSPEQKRTNVRQRKARRD